MMVRSYRERLLVSKNYNLMLILAPSLVVEERELLLSDHYASESMQNRA
jgi:hypothetical protein